jgi:ubiquinone/menaquinone biosynthesis C-methylase UbiE/uncharacterized protein YbaR (Trm112 family)
MNEQIITEYLRCPQCRSGTLDVDVFERNGSEIRDAVVSCRECRMWYRLEDGLLELLVPELRLSGTDTAFRARMARNREGWKYSLDSPAAGSGDAHKLGQKLFFDEGAAAYETETMRLPFWRILNRSYLRTIAEWAKGSSTMIEIGGGSGRISIPVRESFKTILSFDISEAMVRRAMRRLDEITPKPTNVHFFVADAENIPIRSASADMAIFTGILHHVAHPDCVIAETARALKADGRLMGMENNRSLLRPVFDKLMNWKRLWSEEADPEHFIISARELHAWFTKAGVKGKAWTRVYVPPHLFNVLPDAAGEWLLRITDAVGQRTPVFRHNGGLVFFTGEKASAQGSVHA